MVRITSRVFNDDNTNFNFHRIEKSNREKRDFDEVSLYTYSVQHGFTFIYVGRTGPLEIDTGKLYLPCESSTSCSKEKEQSFREWSTLSITRFDTSSVRPPGLVASKQVSAHQARLARLRTRRVPLSVGVNVGRTAFQSGETRSRAITPPGCIDDMLDKLQRVYIGKRRFFVNRATGLDPRRAKR